MSILLFYSSECKFFKNNYTITISGSAGLVTSWEQRTLTLAVTGDVRIVRIWDAESELKKVDFPTGADCCVTSLDTDGTGSMMVVGCGDGSVRLFDRRITPNEARVMTWREHNAWVLGAYFLKNGLHPSRLISASSSGDVKIFDLRKNSSQTTVQTGRGITSFAVHDDANNFAW